MHCGFLIEFRLFYFAQGTWSGHWGLVKFSEVVVIGSLFRDHIIVFVPMFTASINYKVVLYGKAIVTSLLLLLFVCHPLV